MKVLWCLLGVLCVAIIGWRFEPSVDLAWFLPAAETQAERVLLERLGQGPGSQLLFVVLEADGSVELADISAAAAQQLSASQQFANVINGQPEIGLDALPPAVFANRYLLSNLALDDAALRGALLERLADLGMLLPADMQLLLTADPTLATVQILEAASPVAADELQWLDADGGAAYLVAKSFAPAFDLAGQAAAVAAVRSLQIDGVRQVSVHGVGAYGVELQDTIRQEVTVRTVLATLAIVLILTLAYRRITAVLVGVVPLLLGGLAGLATIAALFPQVHGITLAFGFTLLGVAIDYPLHYLSHSRSGQSAAESASLWSTMLLGVVSTTAVFLAIAMGGSQGLAQMGLFSAVGVVVAYLATRTLVPVLAPQLNVPTQRGAPTGQTVLRNSLWVPAVIVLGAALLTVAAPRWTDDLSALSPISKAKLLADQQLRARLGAPDISTLVVVRDADLQAVLEQTEQLASELDAWVQQGVLGGYQSVTALVPSRQMQEARRAQLLDANDFASRFEALAVAQGFRPQTFQPFTAAVAATAAGAQLVTPETYAGTGLESLVTGRLYQRQGEWVSTVALFALRDAASFSRLLADNVPAAKLIDLKTASNSLMTRYRERVIEMVVLALIAIAGFLFWRLRDVRRVSWVLGTLAAALLLTLLASNAVLGGLSIFNLIAAVLVAGLGMDYALFCARDEPHATAAANTRHAVGVCAFSTCAAFTVLAFSAIPVLQSIGVTVAIGVAASFCFARLGQRQIA